MKRLSILVAVVAVLAMMGSDRSIAADALGVWTDGLPAAWVGTASCDPYVDYNCTPSKAATAMATKAAAASGFCDPYLNYKCLDKYLGDDFVTRLYRYYELEWGKAVAPSDPRRRPGAAPTLPGRQLRSPVRQCRTPNGPMAARKISA